MKASEDFTCPADHRITMWPPIDSDLLKGKLGRQGFGDPLSYKDAAGKKQTMWHNAPVIAFLRANTGLVLPIWETKPVFTRTQIDGYCAHRLPQFGLDTVEGFRDEGVNVQPVYQSIVTGDLLIGELDTPAPDMAPSLKTLLIDVFNSAASREVEKEALTEIISHDMRSRLKELNAVVIPGVPHLDGTGQCWISIGSDKFTVMSPGWMACAHHIEIEIDDLQENGLKGTVCRVDPSRDEKLTRDHVGLRIDVDDGGLFDDPEVEVIATEYTTYSSQTSGGADYVTVAKAFSDARDTASWPAVMFEKRLLSSIVEPTSSYYSKFTTRRVARIGYTVVPSRAVECVQVPWSAIDPETRAVDLTAGYGAVLSCARTGSAMRKIAKQLAETNAEAAANLEKVAVNLIDHNGFAAYGCSGKTYGSRADHKKTMAFARLGKEGQEKLLASVISDKDLKGEDNQLTLGGLVSENERDSRKNPRFRNLAWMYQVATETEKPKFSVTIIATDTVTDASWQDGSDILPLEDPNHKFAFDVNGLLSSVPGLENGVYVPVTLPGGADMLPSIWDYPVEMHVVFDATARLRQRKIRAAAWNAANPGADPKSSEDMSYPTNAEMWQWMQDRYSYLIGDAVVFASAGDKPKAATFLSGGDRWLWQRFAPSTGIGVVLDDSTVDEEMKLLRTAGNTDTLCDIFAGQAEFVYSKVTA